MTPASAREAAALARIAAETRELVAFLLAEGRKEEAARWQRQIELCERRLGVDEVNRKEQHNAVP